MGILSDITKAAQNIGKQYSNPNFSYSGGQSPSTPPGILRGDELPPTINKTPATGAPTTTVPGYDFQSQLQKSYQDQYDLLQQQIDNAVRQNESYIPTVNRDYEDAVNSAYVTRELNKANAGDTLSAMGMTGGASESSLLNMNTGFENTRNEATRGKEDTLAKIYQNSANIRATGNTDLGGLSAEYQKTLANAMQQQLMQQQEQSNWQKQFDLQKESGDRDLFASTVGGYYSDFQAEINRRIAAGADPNSYEILMLKQARAQKQQGMNQAQIEEEQRRLENEMNYGMYQHNIGKPYYNPNSGGQVVNPGNYKGGGTSTSGGGTVDPNAEVLSNLGGNKAQSQQSSGGGKYDARSVFHMVGNMSSSAQAKALQALSSQGRIDDDQVIQAAKWLGLKY